jgi:hypothetical protein
MIAALTAVTPMTARCCSKTKPSSAKSAYSTTPLNLGCGRVADYEYGASAETSLRSSLAGAQRSTLTIVAAHSR